MSIMSGMTASRAYSSSAEVQGITVERITSFLRVGATWDRNARRSLFIRPVTRSKVASLSLGAAKWSKREPLIHPTEKRNVSSCVGGGISPSGTSLDLGLN